MVIKECSFDNGKCYLLKATRIQLSLIDDLDGYFLSRGHMLSKFHLGKVSFANGFQ